MKTYISDKVRASIHFKVKQKKNKHGKVKPKSIIFKSELINYCDENLNCWCDIKCSLQGNKIIVPNFYAKKSSYDLQPFGNGRGWFGLIKHLISIEEYREIKKFAIEPAMKDFLYFDVQFSYNVYKESKVVVENVPIKFYYDFYRDGIVFDY